MRKVFGLAMAIAVVAMMPIAAQDKPQPAPPPAQASPSGGGRQVPLKVQLTLSKFMGEGGGSNLVLRWVATDTKANRLPARNRDNRTPSASIRAEVCRSSPGRANCLSKASLD